MYIISNVFKNIRRFLRKYIFIVCQTAIAVMLVTIALSFVNTSKVGYEMIAMNPKARTVELISSHNYTVDISKMSDEQISNLDVPPRVPLFSDYLYIQNIISNGEFEVAASWRYNFPIERGGQTFYTSPSGIRDGERNYMVHIYFVTDAYIDVFLSEKLGIPPFPNDRTIYIGEEAHQYLLVLMNKDDPKEISSNMGEMLSFTHYDGVTFTLTDGTVYDVVRFDGGEQIFTTSSSNRPQMSFPLSFKEMIFLPTALLPPDYNSWSQDFYLFLPNAEPFDTTDAEAALQYLNEKYSDKNLYAHATATYTALILDRGLLQEVEQAQIIYTILSIVNSMIIVVVGLGLMGLLLMIVKKRLHSTAILLTAGATKTTLCLALLFESIIVMLAGTVVGIIVGSIIIWVLPFGIAGNALSLHFLHIPAIIIGTCAITAATTLLPMLIITRMTPMELLRSQ